MSTTARRADRSRRHEAAVRASVASSLVAAAAEEARQEAAVPAAQRVPVLDVSGAVLRRARVEAEPAGTFARTSPLARLALVQPAITVRHVVVAQRLMRAWEDGGRGVGMGASNYGERVGGGTAKSGIGDATLAALGRQNRSGDEYRGAMRWLGSSWPVLAGVVLDGQSVTYWAAAQVPEIDRKVAVGLLAAAMDRLGEFYAAQDGARRDARKGRVR
jgi:hypothetical protein